jgi:tripartite ATP-independent transporter DctM subunit
MGQRATIERATFSWVEVARAARAAAWEIPLPFVVIGGIYAGLFTATDAAAVMAFYVLITEVLIYRDIKISDLPSIAMHSMVLVGTILLVLGTALGLTNYLIDAEIPDKMFELFQRWVSSKTLFLVLLNIVLLIVNMVEIFSAIIIVVPIIVPIAMKYGIDPIHLGTIFLLNLEIGYMTPPLGLNLFLSNRRFDQPLAKLYKATLPFWLIHILMLLIVTYIPDLSLWPLHLRSSP